VIRKKTKKKKQGKTGANNHFNNQVCDQMDSKYSSMLYNKYRLF
jgi:hypothetical protein